MAKQLARIFGTEEDKINCPFYFKIGACRHGERCSRTHCKPAFSPTILIKHIYPHPVRAAEMAALLEAGGGTDLVNYTNTKVQVDKEKSQEDFLQFFENFYTELGKFGRIESLHVSDNLCDHMLGHVYCKFHDEEDASDALNAMNGRYYNGQKMQVEFSPVFDFRDARCRDFDEMECSRGGFCNFLHAKPIPYCLLRDLEEDCEEDRRRRRWEKQEAAREREYRERRERGRDYREQDDDSRIRRNQKENDTDRKRSREYDRSRDKSGRSRGHDKEREKDKDKERERKKSRKSKRRDSSDPEEEDHDDNRSYSD